jgi:hypothetical protein
VLPVNKNGGKIWPRKCGAEFQISNEKLDLSHRSINTKGGGDYRVRGACDLDFDFVEERRGERYGQIVSFFFLR